MYRRIIRAKRQEADHGKNDEEKKKYADDLFAHKLVSSYGLRVARYELRVVRLMRQATIKIFCSVLSPQSSSLFNHLLIQNL
jgi:hypothetical protein